MVNSPHFCSSITPSFGLALAILLSVISPLLAQAEPVAKADDGPAGAPFALVKDGKALAPLILAADATPRNREAAKELAAAIEKISGAKVEIIEASPSDAPKRGVWIGLQKGIEAFFPGVNLEMNQPEEIRIVTTENHLLIAGRDHYDPKNFALKGLETKQWEYGTANAVYTFIQDPLGVRWLWPSALGEDFPESASITIAPMNLRYHPQFRNRMGILALYDEGTVRGGAPRDWARHQRMLLDSMDIEGGHAFSDWWDKYGETRPELFALQPDGTRGTHPAKPNNKKLCDAEPAVWDMWLEQVGEKLEENPMRTIFNVAQNDGWGSGLCVDPRSQAWDPPITEDSELVAYYYANGVKLERPPISDRYVTFANKLADMLQEKYPGRGLKVQQIAYGGTGTPAPVSARPNENVIVLGVHNFLLRGKADREEKMAQFDAWSKMAKTLIWRPNMGGSSGWHWGTPDVAFTRVAHDIKWVAERGAIGIYIDMVWNQWSTQGPLYYLLAQLAWDPYADPNAILEDFCNRAYGPAAKTMLSYWRLMEEMRDRIEDESPTRWRMVESPKYYTSEFFKKAQGILDQAAKETAKAADKYQKRVAFTQAGLDYTEFVIDTRAAMQRWEDSKQKDEAAKAYVLANWDKSFEIRKNYPEMAIEWNRVFPEKKGPGEIKMRRSYGLHPETVLKGRFLEEFKAGQTGSKDELE